MNLISKCHDSIVPNRPVLFLRYPSSLTNACDQSIAEAVLMVAASRIYLVGEFQHHQQILCTEIYHVL